MKASIVGISNMDFMSNGSQVLGTKLYFEYVDPKVIGVKVGELFMNVERRKELLSHGKNLDDFIGMPIFLDYDMKGKLIDYEIM